MTSGPVILAIETSQRAGSVALVMSDGRVDHELLHSTARHEDDLMPAIDRLCSRCAVKPVQLSGLGVSIGPGGFTGLRIAVSTAKMLAESLGIALAAVPSALVAAEEVDAAGPVIVCLASKRDATWATRLERGESHWRIVGQPGLATAEHLALADVKFVVADEFLPLAVRSKIEEAGATILPPTFDARACANVAMRMMSAGETTDSLSLAPIYARPPEAVSLWQQRQTSS